MAVLDQGDVNCRCASAELHIFHLEGCRADLCAARELEMEGESMGLVLFRKGGGKVLAGDLEEAGCHVAAVWYC